MVGIYAIVNKTNGRVYIGSSSNLTSRLTSHEKALISNKHPNAEMQKDFNDNCHFEFDVLYVRRASRKCGRTLISRDERLDLYAMEWEYIQKYDSIEKGYNRQTIGRAVRGRAVAGGYDQ